jgi:hypothetical protein
VILFTEIKAKKEFDELLLKFVDASCIVDITSDEHADAFGQSNERRENGIIRLRKEDRRGFNCKFNRDAFVVIISDNLMPLTTVIQKLGRGARSFGISEGAFYTTELQPGSNANLEAQCQKLEISNLEYAGANWAEYIARYNCGVYTESEAKLLHDFFIQDNHYLNLVDMQWVHNAEYLLLTKKYEIPEARVPNAQTYEEQKEDSEPSKRKTRKGSKANDARQ